MYAGPGGNHMKNTFVVNGLSITIEGQPIAIDKLEVTSEMSAQELATSGGLIKALVGELKPLIQEAVKPVAIAPAPTPTSANNYKNSYDRSSTYNKGYNKNNENPKKNNITKEWRKISVPEELAPVGADKYRWHDQQYPCGDSVSIDGSTFGTVYMHIYSMNKKSFIIVRSGQVRYEDDIKVEDFNDFIQTINIPANVKNYIMQVINLK